jgi:hypothetical protein
VKRNRCPAHNTRKRIENPHQGSDVSGTQFRQPAFISSLRN